MLDDGDEAPTFTVPAVVDGAVGELSLDDHVGEDVVVLCFFPGAFNPRCERAGWLDEADLLTLQRNVTVLGIGPDTAHALAAYADERSVEFPLLADTGGDVAAAYGVLREAFDGHRQVPARATFVIDDRGRVAYRWVAEGPGETPDLGALREAIGGVENDESALERYRVAYDYARYGREEFDIALGARADGDWGLAREAFGEAADYFDAAADGVGAARWFAASDELADRLRTAKSRTDHFLQAARWFRQAAAHHVDGADDLAADHAADAERQHDRATAADPLPDPGDLAALADAERPADLADPPGA